MREALDKAVALGMKTVNVLGGEPLAYKHLNRFCQHFSAKVPDGFCGVVSNGTLLTPDRAKSLADVGVNQLSISLDGTAAETHDKNRGVGTFARALTGIHNALEAGIPVTLAYTVTQFNLSDTRDVFAFGKSVGANAVDVQITEPAGRGRKSLADSPAFSRVEGLKAIWRMYHSRPPLYTEVSSKSRFKEFLNRFRNADLRVSPGESCNGGLSTFMVSSGGDLYPCAEYAWEPDGTQRCEGINLASSDVASIQVWLQQKYAPFNEKMRSTAARVFSTCQGCEYRSSCTPCPSTNPEGNVPECEWVNDRSEKMKRRILSSRPLLRIEPVALEEERTKLYVATQDVPLELPMSATGFSEMMSCDSGHAVARMYAGGNCVDGETEDAVVAFLCTLRSHHVIEIDGFDDFVDD
jgi:radical SAM protein with 4Fe4S-binding SPASM domain